MIESNSHNYVVRSVSYERQGFSLLSSSGALIKTFFLNPGETFFVSDLAAGVYFVKSTNCAIASKFFVH
jgi:hypothetical protein